MKPVVEPRATGFGSWGKQGGGWVVEKGMAVQKGMRAQILAVLLVSLPTKPSGTVVTPT